MLLDDGSFVEIGLYARDRARNRERPQGLRLRLRLPHRSGEVRLLDDERICLDEGRCLLSFLPSNNQDDPSNAPQRARRQTCCQTTYSTPYRQEHTGTSRSQSLTKSYVR
jgi:hypothetical protein